MGFKIILKARKTNFKNKIFLTGFHGIGAVGYLVSRYIADQEGTEHLGYVFYDKEPFIAMMNRNRIMLPLELYRRGDFIILVSEILPEPKYLDVLMRSISEWVVRNGFKEAVLIGGLTETVKEDESEEYKVAFTSAFKPPPEFLKCVLERELRIVGPLALLLINFEVMNFPAIAFLPYANVKRADVDAAIIAIRLLNKYYGLGIDTKLLERTSQYEKAIEERIAKIQLESEEKKGRETTFYM